MSLLITQAYFDCTMLDATAYGIHNVDNSKIYGVDVTEKIRFGYDMIFAAA